MIFQCNTFGTLWNTEAALRLEDDIHLMTSCVLSTVYFYNVSSPMIHVHQKHNNQAIQKFLNGISFNLFTDENDVVRNNIHYPVVTGVGWSTRNFFQSQYILSN